MLQKAQICGTEYRKKNLIIRQVKQKAVALLRGWDSGGELSLQEQSLDHLCPAATCHLHFHNFVLCCTQWQYIGIHIHRRDIAQEILDLNSRKEGAI